MSADQPARTYSWPKRDVWLIRGYLVALAAAALWSGGFVALAAAAFALMLGVRIGSRPWEDSHV